MMKKFSVLSALLLFCSCFLCGCGSTAYYRARAAENARRFLLANAPELTPEQVHFVKFNDPVLLTSSVLGTDRQKGELALEKSTSYLHQICVTWNIPGASNLYMVFGVSDARMFSWEPLRLIRKDFRQKVLPEDAAVAASRSYAVNNLNEVLSVKALNNIRFEFPFIARTDFKLNFNTTGKMTEEEIAEEKYAVKKKFQYALYWKNPDGTLTLFCGMANADLAGWKINFSGIIKESELKQNLIGVVRTPEQYDKSIEILKKDLAVVAERHKAAAFVAKANAVTGKANAVAGKAGIFMSKAAAIIEKAGITEEKDKAVEEKKDTAGEQINIDDKIKAADERLIAADERITAADERIKTAEEKIVSADERIKSTGEKVNAEEKKIKLAEEKMMYAGEIIKFAGEKIMYAETIIRLAAEKSENVAEKIASVREKIQAVEEKIASVREKIETVDEKIKALDEKPDFSKTATEKENKELRKDK